MTSNTRFDALIEQYGKVAWDRALERLWSKIDQSGGPDACHPWTLSTQSMGYGQLNVQVFGGHNTVHTLIYELEIGEIPVGYEVDHVCHNDSDCEGGKSCLHRRCANARHLEAVPPLVNGARANGPRNRGNQKTHCPALHPYEGDNIMWIKRIRNGKEYMTRQCAQCNRENARGLDAAARLALSLKERGLDAPPE